MKFYRRHGANIVESELLVKAAGYISAGRIGSEKALAAAFFPFVFVREEKYVTPIFINHERIHFLQQLETLFVGFWIILIFERLYAGWILQLSPEERCLYCASEQEAYRNQHNPDYLKSRMLFGMSKYFKDKRKLTFVEDRAPEVLVGEKF